MNENEYKLEIYVTKDNVTIKNKEKVHVGEYKITKCEFEFTEDYEGLTKKAIFEAEDVVKEMPITFNECDIPEEVLQDGYLSCNIRVYGYDIEEVDGEMTVRLRYSPAYDTFPIYKGSFIPNAEQGEEITPSQFEQYSAALNEGLEEVNEKLTEIDNLDIDASKVGNTATVTITKKDGTEQTVQIFDGEQGIQGPEGPAGADGRDGRDGAIQYTAGANITIENNVISATGGGSGGIPVIDSREGEPIDLETLEDGTYFMAGNWHISDVDDGYLDQLTLVYLKTYNDNPLSKRFCVYHDIDAYVTVYIKEDNVWSIVTEYGDSVVVDSYLQYNLSFKEDKSNKTTSISASSTDTQYPSAKAVYDFVQDSNIPVITGTQENPVDMSTLEDGTYFIKGNYTFANIGTSSGALEEPTLVYINYEINEEDWKLVNVTIYEKIFGYQLQYELDGGQWGENVGFSVELTENKVTSIDENSTDDEYPSAKCVYDLIGDIETLLEEI